MEAIGDYKAAKEMLDQLAVIRPPLQATLDKLKDLPTDINPNHITAAEVAARELSRLDAELGGRVAAFAPVLLRSEAASSSQIEHITASARAIFSAELGARTSRNAELITRMIMVPVSSSGGLLKASR